MSNNAVARERGSEKETMPRPRLTPAEILKRVEALGPLLEEDANEIEKSQHLTPRVRAALVESGAFSIGYPTEGWGGPQMRLDDQCLLLERLAYHNASTAWNIMVLTDGGFFVPKLDQVAARELFFGVDCATAGSTRPAGKAIEVEGGYLLSGRWSFCSGVRDADNVYGGFFKFPASGGEPEKDENGKPILYACFLPKHAVQLHDTWYTTGLSGSGSTEVSVKDAFVPHNYMFLHVEGDGDPNLPPLSRYAAAMVVNEAGVPLGIARRAIDEFRKVIEKPTRTNQFESMKTQDPYVPTAYAEATALYTAARAFVLANTKELSDILFSGGTLTDEQHAKVMHTTYMSGKLCREALDVLLECLGARSVLAAYPFDRLYRDMLTVIRHTNHRKRFLEFAGVLALGVKCPPHLAE